MKVLIAGDFCPNHRVSKLVDSGSYDEILGEVKPIVESADISIVNFETCVNEHNANPIIKQGPNLCTSKNAVEAIKFAGFNVATLANNHFYDYGEQGVEETIVALDNAGINHVGGGKNLAEAGKVLYLTVGSETIAIINCCEHEFSIASEKSGGSNPLNPIKQYYAIKEARTKADYVIVIVHGGHEHYQLPSTRMVETYRFFVDAGADAVVNHHQHCYSGYETYKGKPIFYGLGNFCFDWDGRCDSKWNFGFLVQIDTDNIGEIPSIIPYVQCGINPGIKLLPIDSYDSTLKILNDTISQNGLLESAVDEFYIQSKGEVEHFINPYQTRVLKGLSKRNLIYSFLKKRWILKLRNYIMCESYRDKLDYYFKNFDYEK